MFALVCVSTFLQLFAKKTEITAGSRKALP